MKTLIIAAAILSLTESALAQRAPYPLQADRTTEISMAASSTPGVIVAAASGARARVLVTRNDGADWTSAGPVPSPSADEGQTVSTGRTAIAFDARGTLHLAAELYRGPASGSTQVDVYYSSSPDLGATWTPPVMLDSTGAGGYPKLTIAGTRVFVTWGYRGDLGLHVAWSADAGRTWSRPKETPPDCINTSDVAVVGDAAFVACASYPDGDAVLAKGRLPFTGIHVYRLDASGELRRIAALDSFKGVWPRLLAHDGALVLVADLYLIHDGAGRGWNKCCAAFSRSVDGGRTWSAPADLRPLLAGDDGWDTFFIRTAALDSRGRLHLVVNGSDQATPANGSPGTDARLVHMVLDPSSGRLVHEASLTPPVDGPQGYYPGSVAMALGPQTTLLAWIRGADLHHARFDVRSARD